MLKLSKHTHLTIIGTFAVVFIVVYLYYTITDLRKVQADVARLTKQIASLESSLSSSSCPAPQQPPSASQAKALSSSAPAAPSSSVPKVPVAVKEMVMDDDESVATEDIKKLLDDASVEDDEDGVVEDFPKKEDDNRHANDAVDSIEEHPLESQISFDLGANAAPTSNDDIELTPSKPKPTRGRKPKQTK